MNLVTIVIPNYNGGKYISKCLEALKKQTFQEFKVLIVDNGSEDESLAFIYENQGFLDLAVIQLDNNYGFSRAVNEGIRASESEYIILLNNDTYVGIRFVEKLIKSIQESDDIFSSQALMLQYHNRQLVDSAGDYFCILGWAYAEGKDEKASMHNKKKEIFSSCAGAAIYRKSILDEIGLFDETFFAYLEDVDISYRAKIYGYRNVYSPEAKVLHIGSGVSGSRYNAFKVSLASRNAILLMYKNFSNWQIMVNFIPVLCGIIIKTMYFARKKLAGEYLKGVFSALSRLPQLQRVQSEKADYIQIEKELLWNTLKRIGINEKR